MTIPRELISIQDRLRSIGLKGQIPLWPPAENASASVVFNDLFIEWSLHYAAFVDTLGEALTEIADWHSSSNSSPESKALLIKLPVFYLERACKLLEADTLSAFLNLLKSIVESAAKLAGLNTLQDLLEWYGTFERIISTAEIEHRDALAAHSFLATVEASMQSLLLAALAVETQAGILSGRLDSYEPVDESLLQQWKEPVVARLRAARDDLSKSDVAPQLTNFPISGHWPLGLQ